MSKTGDWGDKIITTLHSDGIRRHKKWCDNYDGGHCLAICSKCIGSAHCNNYINKDEKDSHSFYIKKIGEGGSVKIPNDKIDLHRIWCEFYHLATYGDHLLHKTILVKKTPFTFRIGTVTSEDLHYFIVKYDGSEHKYEKKAAYRNKSVYVFDGIEELNEHSEI